MTTEEALHLYTPTVADKGYLSVDSIKRTIAVKVVAVDGNSVTVMEHHRRKGNERRKWTVPDWHEPFEFGGKKAVFIDQSGYFRVAVAEGMELLSAGSFAPGEKTSSDYADGVLTVKAFTHTYDRQGEMKLKGVLK